MASKKIIVLGAGVSGLTTAVLLLEEGFEVKIVAEYFPNDVEFEFYAKYDKQTFFYFRKLSEQQQETGIMKVDYFQYYEDKNDYNPLWYKKGIFDSDEAKGLELKFRHVEKEDLSENFGFAFTHPSVTINPNQYLKYLFEKFKSMGGTCEQKRIFKLEELFEKNAVAIVNCSGLGSAFLTDAKDPDVYPIRGQIVIAKSSPHTKESLPVSFSVIRKGNKKDTYCIPRNDGTVVLGGTYDEFAIKEFENLSSAVPNDETAEKIIERCITTRPDLFLPKEELEKKSSVGFRPARKDGVRVEIELMKFGEEQVRICHNYGHGGGGKY
ncbi:3352_t:CDS:2 [Racocetra persica]|uniref:3352_t:CDS:1 n=1 Tax=Racocetra persica TaxID=160502 RepID=A0ACA9KPA1_9GLOM|nr:3352_t:CDS:2 [Racocetra persica]